MGIGSGAVDPRVCGVDPTADATMHPGRSRVRGRPRSQKLARGLDAVGSIPRVRVDRAGRAGTVDFAVHRSGSIRVAGRPLEQLHKSIPRAAG